jgi:hypothetical protein
MRQVSQVNPVREAHFSKIYSSLQEKMAGPLLDNIYQSTYDEQMRSLLKESKVFGIALFGDGATIQKVPIMIFLGSSPNNPFALLDILDCTSEMAKGGKKDAKYIAGLLKPIISIPTIKRLTTRELLTCCCLMVLAMCRMPQN